MVFGFLKKIFEKQKKEEVGEEKVVLTWDDLEDIEGEEKVPDWSFLGELSDYKESIEEILERIENYQFKDEELERMKSSPAHNQILKIRPDFVKEARKVLEIMPDEIGADKREFQRRLERFLKQIQRIQMNQGKKIVIFFEEDMLQLGSILNSISDINEELKRKLGEIKGDKLLIERIDSQKNEIKNIENTISEFNKKFSEKEKDIEENNLLLEEKKEELENLKESEEYRNLNEKKERYEELQEELILRKNQVVNQLSGLNKVLKQYLKKMEGGYPGNPEVLQGYLNNPKDYFMEDKGFSGLQKLIKTILDQNKKEKFKLKGKKGEKTKKLLENINFSSLSNIQEDADNIKKEIILLESQLEESDISKKVTSLQKDIKEIKNKIEKLHQDKNSLMELKEKKEKQLEKEKKALENLLTEFKGKEVTIKI